MNGLGRRRVRRSIREDLDASSVRAMSIILGLSLCKTYLIFGKVLTIRIISRSADGDELVLEAVDVRLHTRDAKLK